MGRGVPCLESPFPISSLLFTLGREASSPSLPLHVQLNFLVWRVVECALFRSRGASGSDSRTSDLPAHSWLRHASRRREFEATRLNQLWVADMTLVATGSAVAT